MAMWTCAILRYFSVGFSIEGGDGMINAARYRRIGPADF